MALQTCCFSTKPIPGQQTAQVEQPKTRLETTQERAERLRLLASDVPWFKIAARALAKRPVRCWPVLIRNNPRSRQKFRHVLSCRSVLQAHRYDVAKPQDVSRERREE